MREKEIIEKLKNDIASRKENYQKDLEKIQKEESLLRYIKGMLDITADHVASFPYYDGSEEETKEARTIFNEMLKCTLKEDSIIEDFQSEIKNLYFLEKIGYQHAIQYQETLKKLEFFRSKIEQAYQTISTSQNLEEVKEKKQQVLVELNQLVVLLEDKNQEIEDIDELYKKLQYTSLPETDKSEILLLVLKRNTRLQSQRVSVLQPIIEKKEPNNSLHRKNYIILSKQELQNLQKLLIDKKKLQAMIKKKNLSIKITTNKVLEEEVKLQKLKQYLKQQCRKVLVSQKEPIPEKNKLEKEISTTDKILQILKNQYTTPKKEV